jgi:hypothetical protein
VPVFIRALGEDDLIGAVIIPHHGTQHSRRRARIAVGGYVIECQSLSKHA